MLMLLMKKSGSNISLVTETMNYIFYKKKLFAIQLN